jgi:hypothetical protein
MAETVNKDGMALKVRAAREGTSVKALIAKSTAIYLKTPIATTDETGTAR